MKVYSGHGKISRENEESNTKKIQEEIQASSFTTHHSLTEDVQVSLTNYSEKLSKCKKIGEN